MKKRCNNFLLLCVIFLTGVWSGSSVLMAQNRVNMTKWEYYDKLCRERGIQNKLAKPSAFADRKYVTLDVGRVRTQIQNTNRLCYAREMINFEYPKLSGIHYAWTEGVVVAGILNGEKRLSNSCLGAFSDFNEDHFEPYPGYDSGIGQEGIAINTNPNSWASAWPGDSGPIGSLGFPGVRGNGEVAGDAEAFWVAGDDVPDSKQQTPLHVKTWGRALQWSSPLADDFIVWKFYITNVGTDTIKDCYVGTHGDIDCPEEGLGEWMDDFGVFIPKEEDPILGNMLYIWDGDDQSSGYVEKGVAWTAMKMLETPVDEYGEQYGLTQLIVMTYDDFWGGLPLQSDYYNRFQGIDPPQNVAPHVMDWTGTPNTYGPDVAVTMASGPFDFAPGDTVTFTFANIFGANKAELLANATLCQLLYDKDYKTAIPPIAPNVNAVLGDQQVTLYWDAEPSESSVDPLTGNNCFEGYRIYRSTDQGLTWGDPIINGYGVTVGYVPIAIYDLKNGISGLSGANDLFNLGSDSGLRHKFVDRNLRNGVEYYYAVCAYDHDDAVGELVIEPLENPRSIDKPNVLTVRPQEMPAGMQDALVSEITHVSGISTGTIEVEVLDPLKVVSGNYEISFTMGSTLVSVKRDGTEVLPPTPVTDPDDPNTGQLPAFDGLRLTAIDVPLGILEATSSSPDYVDKFELWGFGCSKLPDEINHDYEMEFTAEDYFIYSYWKVQGYDEPNDTVNFKVTDVTTGQQIYPLFRDGSYDDNYNLAYDDGERIYLSHTPYGTDPTDVSGFYVRLWRDEGYEPAVGTKISIKTNKPFMESDKYTFSTTSAVVQATKKALDEVRVVPNPYAITSSYETLEWVRELQFHGLPEECTIRIYTVSGDLVAILHHEPGDDGYRGPSVQAWKLWNYNEQEVAFGVYIFHVKAEGFGEKLGKFAIIK